MTTPSSYVVPLDTETTGFARNGIPLDSPDQPHLVQLSALVVDPEIKRVTQSINLIVKPDGWEIPEKVVEVHGISTDHALEVGLPEKTVLDIFLSLWNGKKLIGHNLKYDRSIIAMSIARCYGLNHELVHLWLNAPGECVQQQAKPIVKALNKRGHIKLPRLEESFEFLFGTKFDNAHSANADTVATMQVWFALQEWED